MTDDENEDPHKEIDRLMDELQRAHDALKIATSGTDWKPSGEDLAEDIKSFADGMISTVKTLTARINELHRKIGLLVEKSG